jgi:predicted house-cleaning noncanonical NTP pyrophosphatase (MazG superfamily)
VLPLLDDGYSPIVIPADAFPPRKLELALPLLPEDDKVEEQAAPVMEDEPSIVFTTTPEPVVEEAAPVVTMAAPVVEEEKPVELEAPKPVIMDVHAAAKAAAVAAATPRAPVAPRVVQPVVRPEAPAVVRPDIAALLTGDTVIYTPRKSVEDILVESKMQAVEEYHRAKTEDKKMSFEEKVALLEDKLLEEIHTTPSDAANPTVPEFIEVLERVGEQQRKTKQTATAEGRYAQRHQEPSIGVSFSETFTSLQ